MNRRVMGMALWQVLLLAGLGLGNLCVVCYGISAISTIIVEQAALPTAAAGITSVAQVTNTPSADATVGADATETPLVAEATVTPTSGPTPTPIPGWERFVGNGVELWVPESFMGGDPALDMDVIVQQVRAFGADYAEAADKLEQELTTASENNTLPVLMVLDTNISGTVALTGVEIYKEAVDPDVELPLDTVMTNFTKAMDPSWKLVERQLVQLDRYPAGLLIFEYKLSVEGGAVWRRIAFYVLRADNTLWVVQYYADRENFRDFRPIMEQSIETFAPLAP